MKKDTESLNVPMEQTEVLLHTCCAPCSSAIIECLLKNGVRPTIYYCNPNIFPQEEYQIRKDECTRYAQSLGLEIIDADYNHEEWLSNEYPLKDLPEGSIRCRLCYSMRMRRAYDYAYIHHFDYWTTVLSVSPHKNSQWINEIGQQWQKNHLKFLYADFKKNNGYLKSTQMTKEYDMYRQNYCGCEFSYREMLEREEKRAEMK